MASKTVDALKRSLDQGAIAVKERSELVAAMSKILNGAFMINCLMAYGGVTDGSSIPIDRLAPPIITFVGPLEVSKSVEYLEKTFSCVKATLEIQKAKKEKAGDDLTVLEELVANLEVLPPDTAGDLRSTRGQDTNTQSPCEEKPTENEDARPSGRQRSRHVRFDSLGRPDQREGGHHSRDKERYRKSRKQRPQSGLSGWLSGTSSRV